MRLEYLTDGSCDCPLIRLYDFRSEEVAHFAEAVRSLAAGTVERAAVHELSGVISIGGCKLVLVVRSRDAGVVQVGPSLFECRFTTDTWDNVAGFVEALAESPGGHQWLAGSPGEVPVLLSASGEW